MAREGPGSDAGAGLAFEDEKTSGRCVRPIAAACNGPCPDLHALETRLFDAGAGITRCDGGTYYSDVQRGTRGPHSFIAISTGYVAVTDWFDGAGMLIGEARSSDAPVFCNYESALFGRVPVCPDPERKVLGTYCAGDVSPLLHPVWRSNEPTAQPCTCAAGDPLCVCP